MPENIEKMEDLSETDQARLAQSGLEVEMKNRSGSFFQIDQEIKHVTSTGKGIEVLTLADALSRYDWLKEYM